MKTITSFIYVAFALLLQAQAAVPAPDGDEIPPHGDRFTKHAIGGPR